MKSPLGCPAVLGRYVCIAAVAAGLWAAAGCSQQAAAIRVGDSHVSHSQVTDQLESMRAIRASAVEAGLADPSVLEGIDGELDGSFSRAFVAENVRNRITTLLVAQLFDDAGLEVTGQDWAIEQQRLEQGIPGFGDLEDSEQDRIVEEEAIFQVLQREMCPNFVPSQEQSMCPDLVTTVEDLYERTDIEVSSKLGDWDRTSGSLVPPDGPLVQSSDSGDGEAPAGSPLGVPIG